MCSPNFPKFLAGEETQEGSNTVLSGFPDIFPLGERLRHCQAGEVRREVPESSKADQAAPCKAAFSSSLTPQMPEFAEVLGTGLSLGWSAANKIDTALSRGPSFYWVCGED
jgi:hypothetical protein